MFLQGFCSNSSEEGLSSCPHKFTFLLLRHVSMLLPQIERNTDIELVVKKYKIYFNNFNTLYRASFIILYNDKPMHNFFTNFHTAIPFDTIMSSSGSL